MAASIRVRVELFAERKRSATLVLDTGSSLTLISPALAQALGAVGDERIPLITAGGSATARRVHLSSISLYGEDLGEVAVAASSMPASLRADGLLGLDAWTRDELYDRHA